jgi:uncharacterized membrane protein YeiB
MNPDQQHASAATPGMGPVRARQRLESIDILRGLALFGVLIVNLVMEFQRFDPSKDARAVRSGHSNRMAVADADLWRAATDEAQCWKDKPTKGVTGQ